MLGRFKGSIFESGADWLVCPVCCVPGVMGAGLAKSFADRYSGIKLRHKQSRVSIGNPVFLDDIKVVLFPTKDDWKNYSKIEWIELGLSRIDKMSVAFPMLGCGLGGLRVRDVVPLIEKYSKGKNWELWD